MSLRVTILAAAAAVLLALAVFFVAACGELHEMCEMLAFGLWIVVLPPAAIMLGIALWKRNATWEAWVALIVMCTFIPLTWPALRASNLVIEHRMSSARRVADRVAASIETFREAHGRLPRDLEEMRRAGLTVEVPALAPTGFYEPHAEHDCYLLYVDDPREWSGWVRYSDSGEWEHWRD